MEEPSKSVEEVLIIGKGHSDCFRQLLKEWWLRQLFVDLSIICLSEEHYTNEDRNFYQDSVSANRSVLAATSPVLAKILDGTVDVEDLTTIYLIGYTCREVKYAVQYAYTGVIPSTLPKEETERILSLLRSLEIPLPVEQEISAADISEFLDVEIKVSSETPVRAYSAQKRKLNSQLLVSAGDSVELKPRPNFERKVTRASRSRSSLTKVSPDTTLRTYSRGKVKKYERPSSSSKTVVKVPEPPVSLDLPLNVVVKERVTLQNPTESQASLFTSSVEKATILGDVLPTADPGSLPALLKPRSMMEMPKPNMTPQATPKNRKVLHTYVKASSLNQLRMSDIKSIYQLDGKVQVKINGAAVQDKDLPAGGQGEYEQETGEELKKSQADYRLALQYLSREQLRFKKFRERYQKLEPLVERLKDYARKLIRLRMDRRARVAARKAEAALNETEPAPPSPLPSRPNKHARVSCRVCNKDVKVSWLPTHMAIHSGEKPHQCELCGRSFALSYMLRTHKRTQHAEQLGLASDMFLCSTCGKSFKDKGHLKSHMATHSTERPHVCRFCGKAFRLRTLVVQHERIHTGEKPFQCNQCGAQFKQSGNLHAHLSRHAKRDVYSGSKRQTWSHNFLCPHCPLTFSREMQLRVHIATHTGEVLQLKCSYCPQTFPSLETLTAHKRETHADLRTRCQVCRRLVGHDNMAKHMKLHETNVEARQRFECPTCGKKFTTRGAMQIHQNGQHAEVKPFQCPHCDKRFAAKGNLTMHIRVHTDERPYKCLHCPKAFRQWKHLQVHKVQHTGERPYVCQFCSKSFKQRTTLDGHLRIHLNTKITCEKCGRVFPSRAQLARHMATEENANTLQAQD